MMLYLLQLIYCIYLQNDNDKEKNPLLLPQHLDDLQLDSKCLNRSRKRKTNISTVGYIGFFQNHYCPLNIN